MMIVLLKQSFFFLLSEIGFLVAIFFAIMSVLTAFSLIIIGIFCLAQINDKSFLLLNNEGILDNSYLMSVGLIPWTDITEISSQYLKTGIKIHIKNPEDYKNRGGMLGKIFPIKSPIIIKAQIYKISYEELYSTIKVYHKHALNNS